jgi:hypothetical protein
MGRLNYHKCGIVEHFPIMTKREESISHTYNEPAPSSYPSAKINITPLGSFYINFQFVFHLQKLLIFCIMQIEKGNVRCYTCKFQEGFC